MSKVPSLPYHQIIRALQRDGWTVVRQRGNHIRLQKRVGREVLKIIVSAHRPVKRSTLAHILKQARLSVDDFFEIIMKGARPAQPAVGVDSAFGVAAQPQLVSQRKKCAISCVRDGVEQ